MEVESPDHAPESRIIAADNWFNCTLEWTFLHGNSIKEKFKYQPLATIVFSI